MLDLQFPQNEESVPYTLEVHHLPRVGPEQLCALSHLGCTHDAGTS